MMVRWKRLSELLKIMKVIKIIRIKNKSTLKQHSKSSTTVRKKNGLSYKKNVEYEQLMKRIEQAEVRMEEIDVLMIEASADYGGKLKN